MDIPFVHWTNRQTKFQWIFPWSIGHSIRPLDPMDTRKSNGQLEIHLTNGMSNGLLIFPSDILHGYWTLIRRRALCYRKRALCHRKKGTLPSEKGQFLCLLKTWGGLAPPPPPPPGSYAPACQQPCSEAVFIKFVPILTMSSYNGIVDGKSFETKTD